MSETTLNEIQRLATAYGKDKIGPERIALYVEHLAEIPVEQLAIVVDRVIRTRAFFPTVSEVYEAWADLMLGPPDPYGALDWCKAEHRRLEAEAEQCYWAQDVLTRGLLRPESEQPENWRDPVTREAVRLCGWGALWEMPDEFRVGYWAKQYAQARELLAKRLQAGSARGLRMETERALKAVS